MRLLIVDDHSLLRDGLSALLQQLGPNTEVLAAADGPAALAIAEAEQNLDAVIVDLAMPGMDGASLIETFGTRRPELPVIVLSASESAADVRRVMAVGALGYVPKSASPETLLSAIRLVMSGEIYVPTLMLQNETAPATGAESPKLTPRQADVLSCMVRGLSNKATARELGMSEKTVKAHVTAILRALGASNRMHAVAIARERMPI
jgi:two-component system, NarL family, nitrate/nitrite response regulator NarL